MIEYCQLCAEVFSVFHPLTMTHCFVELPSDRTNGETK